MTKTVSARVDSNLHSKLNQVCNESGKTVNEYLKEIIEKNLNGCFEAKSEANSDNFEEKIRCITLEDLVKQLDQKSMETSKKEEHEE